MDPVLVLILVLEGSVLVLVLVLVGSVLINITAENPVMRSATVTATIGKDDLTIDGLVFNRVTEPIIGIDWLEAS